MKIEQNIPLAPFTTLRIGGPARFFAQIDDELDLWEAITFARDENIPTFVLGGGSNLVVPDEGYPGLILHTALIPSIEHVGDLFQVSAGTDWNALVLHLCQQGISGMECLAGIPGLVGGSPIQNIGAYGQEVAQTIANVRALDRETGFFTDLSAEACHFAYRTSLFNTSARNRYIVTRVDFKLDPTATPDLSYADLKKHFGPSANPTPLEVYEAVRQIRAAKGMLIDPATSADDPDTRSAGSFFKNPIVPPTALRPIAQALGIDQDKIPHWPTPSGKIKLPAAWLIEQAGFPKGFSLGPVGISSRHTLALINRTGTATCADLLRLRNLITAEVQARFHIPLEQEPVFLR